MPCSLSLPGVPTIVGIRPSQSSTGTLTGADAVAAPPPLRLMVWPVNTFVVDVPFEDVAVTVAV